jgi:carnitine-CoA ligase
MDNAYATIADVLADRAATRPDHEIIRFPDGAMTYGELDERANRMAHLLQSLGTGPGDRAAALLPNGPDFLTTWFGISRGGAVEVPLNVALKGDLLAYQLNQAECSTLVVDAAHLDRVTAIADQLTSLRSVVVAHGTAQSVDGLEVVNLEDALLASATHHPGVTVDHLSPSGVLFTSGTTGPSKGVVRSHANDFTLARTTIAIMGYQTGETLFTAFPLFHLNAKFNSVLPAMLLDGTLVLHDRFSASRFWDICRKEGVTAFNFMGALLMMLMKQPERDGDRDHHVRCAYGAPAPATIFEDFERRFGVRLVEVYGSTELGIATHNTVEDFKIGSCGRPADYFEVEIHDGQDRPCPPGVEGELVVRPRRPGALFTEYYRMPEATLHAFRNLWFHSGDRAVQDTDGTFRYVDRMKDAIRRRGENISSWEVEKSILTHAGVAEAAVIGVPSELTDEEVLAVVVLTDAELTPEQLLDHCQERLPYFAVPRYVRVVDELPKTPSERVEKYRLRAEGLTSGTWDREAHGYEVRR